MSDWIDLQLAHSLGPVKAPDDLWARIQAGRPRRTLHPAIRWGAVAALAASVTVLLARPVHKSRLELAAGPAIRRSLAHEPVVRVADRGEAAPIRQNAACRGCHTL